MEREEPPKWIQKEIIRQRTRRPTKLGQIQGQIQGQVPDIVTWLENLPLELAEDLALHLPYEDVYELCRVSLKLSYICKDARFWRDKAVVEFNFIPQNYPISVRAAMDRYLEVRELNEIFVNAPVIDPNYIHLFGPISTTFTVSSERDDLLIHYYEYEDMVMFRYILDRFIVPKKLIIELLHRCFSERNTDALNYLAKYVVKHNVSLSSEYTSFNPFLLGEYGVVNDALLALIERIPPEDRDEILDGAAYGGHLELVLYLLGKGITSDNFVEAAAFGGQVDIIDYLFSHGMIRVDSLDIILISAAHEGHLNVVEYVIGKGATDLNGALRAVIDGLLSVDTEPDDMGAIEQVVLYLIRQGADPNIILNENLLTNHRLKKFVKDYLAGRVE